MNTANKTLIPLRRPMSEWVFNKSCDVIPGGVNSPARAFSNLNQTPLIIESGQGDLITDVDGYRYIDFCCSWGALIHGHAHPAIVHAVEKQVRLGSTFGIATEIEQKIATKIIDSYPSVDQIRFVSSGTEATMSAIRLARAYTGRDVIVKFDGCYHGHSDAFLVQSGSGLATLNPCAASAGIPQSTIYNTISIPYNDSEAIRQVLSLYQVAAVIVEPVAANMGLILPQPGFLDTLREMTKKTGALLIFDEVITGYRLARGGAQELYDIASDLTCFGKIIGGGFPAAAFGGRRDIMEHLAPLGNVYQAGTLSGNPVAMQAGLTSLELLDPIETYSKLEEKTAYLIDPVIDLLQKKEINACIQHSGSLFTVFFGARHVTNFQEAKLLDLKRYRDFFQFLFQRGIYFPQSQYESNFISLGHTEEHLKLTRDVILEFFS